MITNRIVFVLVASLAGQLSEPKWNTLIGDVWADAGLIRFALFGFSLGFWAEFHYPWPPAPRMESKNRWKTPVPSLG